MDIKIDIFEVISNHISEKFPDLWVLYMADIGVIQIYNKKDYFRYLILKDNIITCMPQTGVSVIDFNVFDPMMLSNIERHISNELL